jgi:hypothetical protein
MMQIFSAKRSDQNIFIHICNCSMLLLFDVIVVIFVQNAGSLLTI